MHSLSLSQAAALRNAHFVAEDPIHHDYDHEGMCADVIAINDYVAELCTHQHCEVSPAVLPAVTLASLLRHHKAQLTVRHQLLKRALADLGVEARRLRLLS